MTLAELGARLREAREARNMTVADVADRLKIPGRILHGVEEDPDRLPRTIYVYHFIKDYAKLMGFSPAEIAEWSGSLEGFENISRPVIAESQPFTSVKPSMLPVVIGALFKVVVVIALAFAAYTAYVHFFASREYEEVPSVQEQAAPASGQSAPAWSKAESAPASPAEQGAEPSAAPVWDAPAAQTEEAPAVTQAVEAVPAEAVPSGDADLVSQPAFAPEEAQPSEAPAGQDVAAEQGVPLGDVPAVPAIDPAVEEAPRAALPAELHHVEVIADVDDCWMGFSPDGRRQQRILHKGDSFSMSFRDSLTVKLGNAGAVRVIYDGKELERGAPGKVRNLRFPPEE